MAAQICVARIGAAHGVRGAVKLWTFTDDPFAVTRYGPLSTKDGARSFEVAHAREAKDHLVATLKGVTTRNEAERLNGIELYVAREQLPATDDDEYYHADLIGLAAVATSGEPLGKVIAIHNFGAGDIIEIAPAERRDRCCCRSPMPWCRRSILPAAACWSNCRMKSRATIRPPPTMTSPRVVPAKAGIHNHRPLLLRWMLLQHRPTLASVVMGPGSRSLRSLGRDDSGMIAMANTHKAWRLHAHNDLRFDDVETPKPAPDGVLVTIEAGMVLSYMGRVLSGEAPYSLPPMPFVPGTNAIGRVIATGENASHVQNGDRVFLSPHLRGDVPDSDPPQILIGLTTTVTTQAALAMQMRWRDGVFAEIAHWPAACVTPLFDMDDRPATELIGLAKLIVPFGGLQRTGLRGGETILINGATGYFGSGAVMLAVSMGAGRVVAVGRKREALEMLRDTFGPRVIPAVVTGDAEQDLAIIRRPPAAAPTSRSTCSVRPRAPRPRCPACARSSAADVWC